MGQLGLIIVFTIVVFFFLIGRFLFKHLSKFYIIETTNIIRYFKKDEHNFGEFLLTILISIFSGILAFLVYKTIMVFIAYSFSTDLIDFFTKNRGVFASSKEALKDPYLIKNILYGLFFTPLAQFASVFLMIKAVQFFMNELNRRANDEIYSASSLVYFSTISIVTFLVIELFAYSQSITFVSTLTNIVLLIGAKLGYVLFFLSILHIELVKNENYNNALHNDWSFNKIEKKLISNKLVLLMAALAIAIVLNFPLYSGFQFESNNWFVLLKLALAGGLFYFILMKTFAKSFDYIGVYMIDDTRNQKIPELQFVNKTFNRILIGSFSLLILILIFVNFRGLIFFIFYTIVFYCLSIVAIYLSYIIGWRIKKSKYKNDYVKSVLLSFGKVLIPAILFMFFVFTLLNVYPKNVNTIKYTSYQRNVIDEKGNVLYFQNSDNNNPSSPIDYDKLPDFFIKALIAKEDRGFFKQNSWFFNKRNWHGISSTGRSNINQQLIKNLAFEGAFPQDVQRKFSEFISSYQLSIDNSPEAILTNYINNVSFNGGSGHTGIVKASYYTFGRSITNINELEMMYLLFTLHRGEDFKLGEDNYILYKQAHLYPDEIKERLLLFAKFWFESELITKKEYKRLKKQELVFTNKPYKSNNSVATNTFFANSIKKMSDKDMVLESSISLESQLKMNSAVKRFNDMFSPYRNKGGCNLYSAAIVVDVQSGGVLAHYGGEGFSDLSKFGEGNPVGSIIKPFVLLELLEQGYQIRLYDGKINGRRTAKNHKKAYVNRFVGLNHILKYSLNAPMQNIDKITNPISLFKSIEAKFNMMSINSDSSIDLYDKSKRLEHTLNYPIGSRRMTVYDISQAYQTLFNGKYAKLNVINGAFNPYSLSKKEYQIKKKNSYNSQNTDEIIEALKLVLERGGTAYSLNQYLPENVQFMAKTGTTDEYRHGYTVLSDGETLVVSWVSYGKEIGGVLKLGQTEIPNRSGGRSAGVLAALIFDELYK